MGCMQVHVRAEVACGMLFEAAPFRADMLRTPAASHRLCRRHSSRRE